MKLVLTILVFVVFTVRDAKTQITVSSLKGKIIEQSTNEPMEYVNVVLYNTYDNSFTKGIVTDKNGAYTFTNVNHGNYYLEISFLGFETKNISSFLLNDGALIDQGIISIKTSSHVLSGKTAGNKFERYYFLQ